MIASRESFALDQETIDRFWGKVDQCAPLGCWQWTAGVTSHGYGQFHAVIESRKRNLRAHRVSYFLCRGEMTRGKVLDHICRNRSCVNPDHLREIGRDENTLIGVGPTAANARKTHCVRGHAYDSDRVRVDRHGYRICRECKRVWASEARARNLGACRHCGKEMQMRSIEKHEARCARAVTEYLRGER